MTHTCHAVGCAVIVAPQLLMCFEHWTLLPKPAQRVIWHYYTPGQEVRKDPTLEYLLAQACAVAIVAFKDRTWGRLQALNHVAMESRIVGTPTNGLSLERREEIIRAMGCEILAR